MANREGPIVIERPNGLIPGMLDVNSYLAETFGVVVAVCCDQPDPAAPIAWKGFEVRKARIENDVIFPGDVLVSGFVSDRTLDEAKARLNDESIAE